MRLGINLIFIHLCCCGVVTYLRHACLCMSEFLYFPFYEIKTVPQFSCLFYFLSLIFLMIKVLSKTLACLAVSCTPSSPFFPVPSTLLPTCFSSQHLYVSKSLLFKKKSTTLKLSLYLCSLFTSTLYFAFPCKVNFFFMVII